MKLAPGLSDPSSNLGLPLVVSGRIHMVQTLHVDNLQGELGAAAKQAIVSFHARNQATGNYSSLHEPT